MDKRGFTPLERKFCHLGEYRKTFSLLRGGVKNTWGFTLIELLIVIAIIGILAGVAVTAYIGTTKKAARSEAYSNLESLRLLEEQFFADNACYYRTGGGACTNATIADVASIQVFLPGFKPSTSRMFDYQIVTSGTSAASCFIATATGITNTRVDGDVFTINCNNIRNF